jgi:ADP-ribose pyrophosphatase YjhB (NUDIX family)
MDKLPVRVNVNAAIVRGNEILLIEFGDEPHFNLPGGGLEPGESVEEGLRRECREEACAEIEVDRLLMVWEYVPEKENFRYGGLQKLGLIFLCRLTAGSEPRLPEKPDPHQIGVRWIELSELEQLPGSRRHPIFPTVEKPLLEALRSPKPIYSVWSEVPSP